MRFSNIEFKNYRCFADGTISFYEDLDASRNINLVLGSNGCGKTELLFAFTWILWGYDFKRLRGKEDAPYALNASRYRSLLEGPVGGVDTCRGGLRFEVDGREYLMVHEVNYRKQGARVNGEDNFSLSWRGGDGEFTVPLHDRREIDQVLNGVLPASTLAGISFDGERMERLSQVNDDSKATISSVIDDITRAGFFDSAYRTFSSLCSEVERAAERRASRCRRGDIGDLNQLKLQLDIMREKIDGHEGRAAYLSERLEKLQNDYSHIQEAISEAEAARELIGEKRAVEHQLQNQKLASEASIRDFLDLMRQKGYLLFVNHLLEDVDGALGEVNIPAGLTASAVHSILDNPCCICGTPLHEEQRSALLGLIEMLPPVSITSTVSNHVLTVKNKSEVAGADLRRCMQGVRAAEAAVSDLEGNIADIDRKLAGVDRDEVSALLQRGMELMSEINSLKAELEGIQAELNDAYTAESSLKNRFNSIVEISEELNAYRAQRDFLRRATEAVKLIRARREREALSRINEKVGRAYESVSEGAESGRSLWLVQFDDARKYQMVSYYQDKLQQGLIKLNINWDEATSEDRERVILKCAEPSSTGQSKVNSLAFVRAVLDYANEEKEEGTFETSKSYPLLIDAPFGDIFDGNLKKSSQELHNFAGQIILMIAQQSYESVKQQVEPFVSHAVRLEYDSSAGASRITEVY